MSNKESIQAVFERCENDQLDLSDMLDELRFTASDPTHTGQWQAERSEILARLSEILGQTKEIHGTVETAAAISEYHRSVVVPLVSSLVHAFVEFHVEAQRAASAPRKAA